MTTIHPTHRGFSTNTSAVTFQNIVGSSVVSVAKFGEYMQEGMYQITVEERSGFSKFAVICRRLDDDGITWVREGSMGTVGVGYAALIPGVLVTFNNPTVIGDIAIVHVTPGKDTYPPGRSSATLLLTSDAFTTTPQRFIFDTMGFSRLAFYGKSFGSFAGTGATAHSLLVVPEGSLSTPVFVAETGDGVMDGFEAANESRASLSYASSQFQMFCQGPHMGHQMDLGSVTLISMDLWVHLFQ